MSLSQCLLPNDLALGLNNVTLEAALPLYLSVPCHHDGSAYVEMRATLATLHL